MATATDKRKYSAILSLGSNQGDRALNLRSAKRLILKRIGSILHQSSTYETEGWGNGDLAPFYNEVLIVRTALEENQLLSECLNIESELGRVRTHQNKAAKQYENRMIDIDILDYENRIVDQKDLSLPHPALHLRKFVLEPLNEVAPQWIHPVLKQNTTQLLKQCTDNNEIKKLKN